MILDCDYHYGNGTDEIIGRLGLASSVDNATFGRNYRTKSQAAMYLEELERSCGRFSGFDLVLYQVPVSKVVGLHLATMEECVQAYADACSAPCP